MNGLPVRRERPDIYGLVLAFRRLREGFSRGGYVLTSR